MRRRRKRRGKVVKATSEDTKGKRSERTMASKIDMRDKV